MVCCVWVFVFFGSTFFFFFFFFSSRRRHTRSYGDWSSDVCSSDLTASIRRAISVACWMSCAAPVVTFSGPNTSSSATRPQIGRASCRERVEVSGGGGVLKKNSKQNRRGTVRVVSGAKKQSRSHDLL